MRTQNRRAVLEELLDRVPPPPGGTTAREVDYDVAGSTCTGYLAVPPGDGPVPGVLVVHDGGGVGDHVRVRADMLARLGYVALAGDLFGSGIRPSEEEASEVASRLFGDLPLFRARVVGAFDRLLAEPRVDRARTAAVGYCLGGTGVLQLARTGADLRGAVSLHGALQPGPEGETAGIRAKLLLLTGALDPIVPDEAVRAYVADLRSAPHLDWQLVVYSGAMHAFTVPGTDSPERGARFEPAAERRSWAAMTAFLDEVLT